MKRLFSFFLLFSYLLLFASCSDEEEKNILSKNVQGFIQKGPFISGSSITIQELDDQLNPTGVSYSIATNDDFGSFTLETPIRSGYIEIIAQGFYFNEVNGEISKSNITLRALTKVNQSLVSNVNVLTTLTNNRIKYLIKNDGLSYEEAKETAEKEILTVFNISGEGIDFNSLDISKSEEKNAILLAVSCILQGDLTEGELMEIISKIIQDVEKDGTLESETIKERLIRNAKNLHIQAIRQNLINRYKSLGLNIEIPPLENYSKKLISPEVHASIPFPNEQDVLISLELITITLNKPINPSSVNSNTFIVKDVSSDKILEGSFRFDSANHVIQFLLGEELLPQNQYLVSLSGINTADGDLLEPHSFSFATAIVDIENGLVAYYPFDGNTQDNSGNNKNANGTGLELTTDRNGVANQAYHFQQGSYLKFPIIYDISKQESWTYSLMVNLSKNPDYMSILLGLDINYNWPSDIPLYIGSSVRTVRSYGSSTNPADNTPLDLNTWYLITMVMEGKRLKVYVNNELRFVKENHEFDPPGEWLNHTGYYIGGETYDGNSTSLFGKVDEVRFYNRALNSSEVEKLFSNMISPPDL